MLFGQNFDFNNDKIYQGIINRISEPNQYLETKQQMEFLMLNCDIYDNNTGKFLLISALFWDFTGSDGFPCKRFDKQDFTEINDKNRVVGL